MRKIHVGVVGLGFGLQHVRGFQDCEDVEVVAVCRTSREKAEQVATRYGIPHVFTNYRDMLKISDLDAVSIATPLYLHYPMTLEALEAGKHVLCEKPLAMNTKQAKDMYERAQASGLGHMTNFCWRFSPKLFHLKELVESGYLGSLYHIEAKWIEGSATDLDLPLNWRHKRAEGGFGALGDLGVHMIDMIQWIAGDFVMVCGEGTRLVKERRDPKSGTMAGTELEDSCIFIAELEHQVPAFFHVSEGALSTNYISLEIYGKEGTLLYQMPQPSDDFPVPRQKASLMGAKRGHAKIEEIETPDRLRNVPSSYELFVDAIRGNRPINPSFLEGLKVQEVIDAVRLSTTEKRWVGVQHVV